MTKEEFESIDPAVVTIVDIRESFELDVVPSLTGVLHIPMTELVEKVNNGSLPKSKKVITICRSGGRCLGVNEFLTQHGYETDYLEGGMNVL